MPSLETENNEGEACEDFLCTTQSECVVTLTPTKGATQLNAMQLMCYALNFYAVSFTV